MTAPQEEWGPWQDHDGKGCPCVGKMVRAVYRDLDGSEVEPRGAFIAEGNPQGWAWAIVPQHFLVRPIIRFRIRKPRALLDMIQLIADLPAPVAPIKTDGVIA